MRADVLGKSCRHLYKAALRSGGMHLTALPLLRLQERRGNPAEGPRRSPARFRIMSQPPRIRVLCVDDHPLLREGLCAVINGEADMLVVAEAANATEAADHFRRCKPDVTLMDLRLPGMSGLDAMIAIRNEFPDARVIILTTFEGDVEIQRALKAGARGYLLKSTKRAEMIEAIRQVHIGKKLIPPEVAARLAEHYSDANLTDRELDVLKQIAAGRRNHEIAKRLFISEETVKVHVKSILTKLDAIDRTHAVTVGTRRGIIHL
jgi:DNA-binding NarL/FixJ family response regulator